ncbi:hypothetical protein [Streptomyces sp. NPDC059224]|uniref:hypothetical protein n=1 Tax=Streptomyces sp. NPDC059224 TaxID=3346775 RepID=UPI0036A51DE7
MSDVVGGLVGRQQFPQPIAHTSGFAALTKGSSAFRLTCRRPTATRRGIRVAPASANGIEAGLRGRPPEPVTAAGPRGTGPNIGPRARWTARTASTPPTRLLEINAHPDPLDLRDERPSRGPPGRSDTAAEPHRRG